jgi:Predicted membrane protein
VLEFRNALYFRKLATHTDWAHTAMVNVLPVDSDRMRQDLLAPRPLHAPETTVTLLPSTRTDFRMRIHAPRHALIVSSQPWWRGWVVTRNGQHVEPQPVNGVFLGFTVPPGDWDVRVHYVPMSFYLGLLASLLAIAALVATGLRRPRRA